MVVLASRRMLGAWRYRPHSSSIGSAANTAAAWRSRIPAWAPMSTARRSVDRSLLVLG
jgi:hypothetical protein